MSPDSLYIIVSSVFLTVIGYDVYNWMRDRTIVAPQIRVRHIKSRINVTVAILGFTMLITSVLLHVNLFRYSSPIPFSGIDQITLRDFKGYRRPFQTLDGGRKFAFVTTSLHTDQHGQRVKVEALFHPARSYVYNERIANDLLLRHELYHFRITEIFARRCREALSRGTEAPTNDALMAILNFNRQLENDMQRRYDEESYHGYIMKQQKQWEKEVDSLLNLLAEYESSIITYE